MAGDAGGNRFLLITLLIATGVLAYYYWDASSSTSALYGDVERLTRSWSAANRTLADLRLELDGCKAQVKVLEDEKNKLKSEAEAKDKQIADKTAAEAKAQEEVKKLTGEKTEFEKNLSTAKTDLETCNKECDDKVKKAKDSCSSNAATPNAATKPASDASGAQSQVATTK
jgi:chromosome segregation ATPase